METILWSAVTLLIGILGTLSVTVLKFSSTMTKTTVQLENMNDKMTTYEHAIGREISQLREALNKHTDAVPNFCPMHTELLSDIERIDTNQKMVLKKLELAS